MDHQLNLLISLTSVIALFFFFLVSFASVTRAFQAFCTWRLLASRRKRLKTAPAAIDTTTEDEPLLVTADTDKTQPDEADFSLWENDNPYVVAIRHRALKVGRKKHTTLFVADYSDGTSKGTVKTKTERVRLRDRVVTGQNGDETLISAATSAAA